MFDFFKKKVSTTPVSPQLDALLQLLEKEYLEMPATDYQTFDIKQLRSSPLLADLPDQEKKSLFIKGNQLRILNLDKLPSKWDANNTYHRKEKFYEELNIAMARFKLLYSEEEFTDMFQFIRQYFPSNREYTRYTMVKTWVTKIELYLEKNALSATLRQAFLSLKGKTGSLVEWKKLNERIDRLTTENHLLKINETDFLGKVILAILRTKNDLEKEQLTRLFNLLLSIADKPAPTQKWLSEVGQLFQNLPQQEIADLYFDLLEKCQEELKNLHRTIPEQRNYANNPFLSDLNHNLVKALIWSIAVLDQKEAFIEVLDAYALTAYKKVPEVGSLSARTGNACMFVFSNLPTVEAIARLTKFKQKIKNNTILANIEKQIRLLAQSNRMSVDDMEEMAVGTFNFNEQGVWETAFGEVIAKTILTRQLELETVWYNQGKAQKSPPAALKESHKVALVNFKKQAKNIEAALQTQKARLERLFLKNKTWEYADWAQHYHEHLFLRHLSRRLIWNFKEADEEAQQVLYKENGFVNALGFPVTFDPAKTKVSLWHPIHSPAEDVLAWRSYLYEQELLQPFKQAYREIYLVTDAELRTETYSNRFAAHILRQHQMAALCRHRNWTYTLQGAWDSHNYPSILLKDWDIRVDFMLEADWNGETTEAGIFQYVVTDQVRFYNQHGQMPIETIPPMVFTELMRDVDLFVGVCSMGNDPYWTDQGNERLNTYWNDYSRAELTESSKVREQALKNLIPRMKIAGKCHFESKFLVVKGKLKTYKIHIGSGNILMQPNDQYLCIVPERSKESKEKVFLPFEGDSLLSVIISKAMLLSEDDKITDTSITSQLGRQ